MGSMGSWEPINFWLMGSGTHQFWKERTIICPLFSSKQARNKGWKFRTLNQHFGTHQFKILTEPLQVVVKQQWFWSYLSTLLLFLKSPIIAIKPELVEKLNRTLDTDDAHPRVYDVSKLFDKIPFAESVAGKSWLGAQARNCRTPQPERPGRPIPR